MPFTYMLAPIEGFSDSAFRKLCHNHGADLTFSVIASLNGLAEKNIFTIDRIAQKDNTPTQIQLAVQSEQTLGKFLETFTPNEGFRGFNLNLGCPDPKLVRIGLGCAMMKRVSKVQRIITIIKDHDYPCSIKMRLGMNSYEKEKRSYLNLMRNTDADFYIVHARHGKETYGDPPDYSVYAECVDTGKDIIANGDIDTKEKVRSMKDLGAKGVMIGRSAVRDPAIFDRLKGNPAQDTDQLKKEYLELAKNYPSITEKYKNNILKRIGTEK